MGICFLEDPKTDNNFWCFATLHVNREVFGYLLLTRQTKKCIKGAPFGKWKIWKMTTTATLMPILTRAHMSRPRVSGPLFDPGSPLRAKTFTNWSARLFAKIVGVRALTMEHRPGFRAIFPSLVAFRILAEHENPGTSIKTEIIRPH
jgi:hypothetical protein